MPDRRVEFFMIRSALQGRGDTSHPPVPPNRVPPVIAVPPVIRPTPMMRLARLAPQFGKS